MAVILGSAACPAPEQSVVMPDDDDRRDQNGEHGEQGQDLPCTGAASGGDVSHATTIDPSDDPGEWFA